MNKYHNNDLMIYSDFEIRILREMDKDVDLLVPTEQRVLNLYIEGMPQFVSNRFQFTEVKNVIIRHTMDRENTNCTIHFLRSIDMHAALVNFAIDYKDKAIRIVDKEYSVDMYINKR